VLERSGLLFHTVRLLRLYLLFLAIILKLISAQSQEA